eukprot:9065510-Ditylum_brightwellii.AAC.1
MTTKGLRHIQMCNNAVREAMQSNFVEVCHVGGEINLANILTKEDKDSHHFLTVCDNLLSPPPEAAAKRMTVSAGDILRLHHCLRLAYVDPTYT